MFLRRSLALLLIGVGIGSPWLVRDWLASEVGSSTGKKGESTWAGHFREKFQEFGKRWKTGGAAVPVSPTPVEDVVRPDTKAEREPYELASQTRRIMEGFFGGSTGTRSGGLASWFPSSSKVPETARSRSIVDETLARLEGELVPLGLAPGDPVFLRIFKEESELEIWMKPAGEPFFALFKVHRLSSVAGQSGPKLREGDGQAPEGFYEIGASSLRPETRHYLGIDLGFPNAYDQSRGRTGSDLMIHGGSSTAGGFALAPGAMDEVYALADAAFRAGQDLCAIHLFPFRLTDSRMDRVWSSQPRWTEEWVNFKEGFDFFENVRQPPAIALAGDRYDFRLVEGEN